MAFSPLDFAGAGFISQQRVDYANFLEQQKEPPPVAFGDRRALDEWIKETYDSETVININGGNNAIYARGEVKGVSEFGQIWVAKSYSDYRPAMKQVAKEFYGETNLNGIDADHVIAKTMLSNVKNAWVALFPVPSSSNRGHGNLEAMLPKYCSHLKSAKLTPTAMLKIYTGKFPQNTSELESAMKDLRGQIGGNSYIESFISDAERELRQFFQN